MPFNRPIHGDARVSDTVWAFTALTRDKHWIWTGPTSPGGIPITPVPDAGKSVRKLVYEAFSGPLPSNTTTYSRCGKDLCVNPLHTGLEKKGGWGAEGHRRRTIIRFWS